MNCCSFPKRLLVIPRYSDLRDLLQKSNVYFEG